MIRSLVFSLLVFSVAVSSVLAGDGATLKGQFLYDGTAPKPRVVEITKDVAFCGKFGVVDESLVVGKNGGVANLIVYLYLARGDKIEVHPAYNMQKDKKVVLDNDKCRFRPRVALLWTEQTIALGNKDAVAHNTKVEARSKPINPILPPNASLDQKFTSAERLPVQVSCSIHPWMTGWMVIKDNPYFAVTDEEGKFEIKSIPPGEWTFQFWHERVGYVSKVKQNGRDVEWTRGRVEVKAADGGTVDLGTVKIAADAFKN